LCEPANLYSPGGKKKWRKVLTEGRKERGYMQWKLASVNAIKVEGLIKQSD
jgi:hypothetical protein